VLAAASLVQLLKRQRDAVGLSVYSNIYEYYSPEKGSERHHQMLLNELDRVVSTPAINTPTDSYTYLHQLAEKLKRRSLACPLTDSYTYLHQIAEKLKRRSLVFLFTDMFQEDKEEKELFEALKHLKYNKHEVVLFHVIDREKELNFNFDNSPRRFIDVETGKHI